MTSEPGLDIEIAGVKIRERECVTGVRLRGYSNSQGVEQDELDLLFAGGTTARDAFFHRPRRVLHDRGIGLGRGKQAHPTHMPEFEGRIGVPPEKDAFHDGDLRSIGEENRVQLVRNPVQPIMKSKGGRGGENTVREMADPIAVGFEKSVSSVMTAGIDPQNHFHVAIQQRGWP